MKVYAFLIVSSDFLSLMLLFLFNFCSLHANPMNHFFSPECFLQFFLESWLSLFDFFFGVSSCVFLCFFVLFQSKWIIIGYFWPLTAPLWKFMWTVPFGISLCQFLRSWCSKMMNEFFWGLGTRMWNVFFLSRAQRLIWWGKRSLCRKLHHYRLLFFS